MDEAACQEGSCQIPIEPTPAPPDPDMLAAVEVAREQEQKEQQQQQQQEQKQQQQVAISADCITGVAPCGCVTYYCAHCDKMHVQHGVHIAGAQSVQPLEPLHDKRAYLQEQLLLRSTAAAATPAAAVTEWTELRPLRSPFGAGEDTGLYRARETLAGGERGGRDRSCSVLIKPAWPAARTPRLSEADVARVGFVAFARAALQGARGAGETLVQVHSCDVDRARRVAWLVLERVRGAEDLASWQRRMGSRGGAIRRPRPTPPPPPPPPSAPMSSAAPGDGDDDAVHRNTSLVPSPRRPCPPSTSSEGGKPPSPPSAIVAERCRGRGYHNGWPPPVDLLF